MKYKKLLEDLKPFYEYKITSYMGRENTIIVCNNGWRVELWRIEEDDSGYFFIRNRKKIYLKQ